MTARLNGAHRRHHPAHEVAGDVMHVSVTDVIPAPDNPRESLGTIEELVASIRTVGILQPLVVVRQAGPPPFMIVCGERRWAAALEVGLERVPVLVRELTEQQRVEAMLIENLQRSNFSRLEEARAFQHLLSLGLTQVDIARRVGKSQSYVCRRLLLLALPETVRERVERGEVPVEQALGYQSAPAEDAFAADEALQRAWLVLRQEILERGDRRLLRMLREFANAYRRRVGPQAPVEDAQPPPSPVFPRNTGDELGETPVKRNGRRHTVVPRQEV
jgi:ParB family chromosome partitioning protein